MNTAITTIEGLRQWFLDNRRPFFTLYLNGTGEKVVMRNVDVADMERAWELLQAHVMLQAGGGVANLKIYTTEKANNPNGVTTYIRIVGNPYGQMVHGSAGIAGMPVGPGVLGLGTKEQLDAFVAEKLATQKRELELERRIADLEKEKNEGADWLDKALDKVAESPQLAGLVKPLVEAVARLLAPQPRLAPAVNGIEERPAAAPAATRPDNDTDEDDPEFQAAFDRELNDLCEATGMDEVETLRKINGLRQAYPDMFNQLIAAQ